MAEAEANGVQALDREALRRGLLTSSTKRRIAELQTLQQRIEEEDISQSDLESLPPIIFDTYPYYVDRASRRAVEHCIRALTRSEAAVEHVLPSIVDLIANEAPKPTIASSNTLVLTEWCSALLQEATTKTQLWDKIGTRLVLAQAQALETCIGSGRRESVRHSALVIARRGLRVLLKRSQHRQDLLTDIVSTLAVKGPACSARNAVYLGVLGGVCSRLPPAKLALEGKKKEIYAFYTRELVNSRIAVPLHVAHGLYDFFISFTTYDDLRTELIPPIEKGLLRAPEIILQNVLVCLIKSLPAALDLSEVLGTHLLKPFLSDIRSTNVSIRDGAVAAFATVASRCPNTTITDKLADEVLNPLKQNKVAGAEQKVCHARMLEALHLSEDKAQQIPKVLAPVALKEANEPASRAETEALRSHLLEGLLSSVKPDPSISESISKGLSDKKPNVRKYWALRVAEIVWALNAQQLQSAELLAFLQPLLTKLADIFAEITANPLPAAQNGLVTAAYTFTALCQLKVGEIQDAKVSALLKKSSVVQHALAAEPKPSFLLNHRIYTKLSAEEDLAWSLRALIALAADVASLKPQSAAAEAWSVAMIYHLVATAIAPRVRREALRSISETYLQHPAEIAAILTNGLYRWARDVETEEKDSAAAASKTGNTKLFLVIRAICLSPIELSRLGAKVEPDTLHKQLVQLMVVCRQSMIPRVTWIDTCLRTATDPGDLVRLRLHECIQEIIKSTMAISPPAIQQAAYDAAADLAFVAPDVAIPAIVTQLRGDLNPVQLANLGPTEAAIYRTPEGTAFIDVLAVKSKDEDVSKNSKDYDTLKWEQELRAQLAQKKPQAKKLTADEKAKVDGQLKKESAIRKDVTLVDEKMKRGVGIISALATGPPTEAALWIGDAIALLVDIIKSGVGLLLGDAASSAYIHCADRVAQRLGIARPFIGIATLRIIGTSYLPEGAEEEPLGDMVTRILYRLRFVSEQRPLDTVSLLYALPLIFLVLEHGGVDRPAGEEADEQLILALEFLSFHTDACADELLPREQVIRTLLASMQIYTQHFKLVRDCLMDLCRAVAAHLTDSEVLTLLSGCIVAEVPVRTTTLQAIDAEIDLSGMGFSEEIWLACHDDMDENVELAQAIWEESAFQLQPDAAEKTLRYLEAPDKQLRRAAARALGETALKQADLFDGLLGKLQELYKDCAKPREPAKDKYGMPLKVDNSDPWPTRDGVAMTFKELSPSFHASNLVPFMQFMVHDGPLGDAVAKVREEMIDAAVTIIASKGQMAVEDLMKLFEGALESPNRRSASYDAVNEAVIILYGALARHLPTGDERVPKVVQRLMDTLSTPSETVQYAVAECLPPLIRASSQETSAYVQRIMDELLQGKKYAERRGAAYGLAGVVQGKGISALREYRILASLKGATEDKKDGNRRQGAYLAFELLSLILGRVFEPYVIQIIPQLLAGFGDPSADVRDACLDASKQCFSTLSSYGVKQVLPTLLDGLDETQWRSKKGAVDSLGAMAYLDPEQLATSLPEIIPPLTEVLNDSHKEVRASGKRALLRFGEVINNPEIKTNIDVLLKALSDPVKHTDDALDALIKVSFIHYLDAPALALVVRILERGLAGDRSATKRKSSQIIGSLAHLTERKDLIAHLPMLVAGLRVAIVDPVPTTRATASKALGSTIEKLGEEALPDLIPSLMNTLKSDTGAGDRLGSAQALSEVLAGLGTGRLEETLPTILQNVASSKPSVREGFMSLFIFLPACFGNSFSNYLSKIIPPILAGLADDVESIRDTALRAGRLLVKNFATRAIDLLLPELERGLADDSYRIRLSSVELVGDLLFNLTGISGKQEAEEGEELEENAREAGSSLLEVLGEEKRNKVLSALYICRCDTSGLVRAAAINVWKALVATPRTLRELVPTLTQLLIRRLASSNMEQKVIAGNALGELIRKAGDGVLATLLPTLEDGLINSTDNSAKQGICIALRELITSAAPEVLEEYEKTLISVVRSALVDPDDEVREAAAEAFDSLQQVLGKKAVDQVLPNLLNLLRSVDDRQNALSALLTLLEDTTRSNIILPNLLPTLLQKPISAFNARALASLAEVANTAMARRLPNILNTLMDDIVSTKDNELRVDIGASFDKILLSVDEYDGLNTMMSVMLAQVKHNDHWVRKNANTHLGSFVASAEIDFSRYYPDLIRVFLIAFDDGDPEVVKAAFEALTELTKRLRKEEMESLVVSTRQVLQQVGVRGHDLPGFSLPKGINAVLPIFLQGLMNGTADQRTQAALAISDIIDRTSPDALKPYVANITGPLIRVVSERSVEVKAAILLTLSNLLEKIPIFLKPFLPQLQRTFAKSLADTTSEVLRTRAAKALGTLITMTPRVDPLIAELVTGSKTSDAGVRTAMLKALHEVVSKAGKNMSEASRNAVLGLIDLDASESDDNMAMTNARLLGALIKVLPLDTSKALIKSRVLGTSFSKSSVLALNAILLEAPESLTTDLGEDTVSIIAAGIRDHLPLTSNNCVLAAGKYLLTESSNKNFEATKPLFDALAPAIEPGSPTDTRRLALVVIRTIARTHNDLVRPHIALLTPPIFSSVRDMVIPVKLAAEAAFLALFSVVDEESAVFEKYMQSAAGQALPQGMKRAMPDYFRRVALRLAAQARERRDAEGGAGGLGLESGEAEDEREIWSVGRVDLGEGVFDG